jgi:thiol-disulfide isomerase/thioredoxin
MKKITLLFILCLTITSQSYSQSKFGEKKTIPDLIGYNISGEIEGLQDTSVMLAYYFGGKQYATDTTKVVEGKFSFEGERELQGGMYLVVLANQQYFDIIVSEQHFSFSTKLDDLIGSMSFKNSNENPPFYEYLNFITQMQKQVTPIRQQLETAEGDAKKVLQEKANAIDVKVKKFREDFMINNKDKFFSKIVTATTEIQIPQSPLDSTGNPDKTFPYRFYKNHFWDNIDFSDSRMLRTPIFFNKMDQYLNKLTAKHPDSINVSADVLIKLSKANGDIFQYVVSYITSTYERSKIMGMDAVFVHMVEKYYITNQCDWVDSTQLVKIADRAQKIAPNLIGREASEFLDFYGRPFMKDTLGKTHTLQEINADYSLVVFYGPTCGHCKKEIPRIKNELDSLIGTGVNIKTFAVATEFDKAEWKKFINTKKIGDWINVADINHDEEGNPVASSDWRDKYDIYSTPVLYLLDKDKKIIAKRISYKQITEIIGRIEGNK